MLNTMEFGAGRVGPESCRIADLKREFVASPLETLAPFYISRAKGALITDVDGNQYIDFTGGWGCLIVGHTPDRVVEAICDQAAKYTHTDFSAVPC